MSKRSVGQPSSQLGAALTAAAQGLTANRRPPSSSERSTGCALSSSLPPLPQAQAPVTEPRMLSVPGSAQVRKAMGCHAVVGVVLRVRLSRQDTYRRPRSILERAETQRILRRAYCTLVPSSCKLEIPLISWISSQTGLDLSKRPTHERAPLRRR